MLGGGGESELRESPQTSHCLDLRFPSHQCGNILDSGDTLTRSRGTLTFLTPQHLSVVVVKDDVRGAPGKHGQGPGSEQIDISHFLGKNKNSFARFCMKRRPSSLDDSYDDDAMTDEPGGCDGDGTSGEKSQPPPPPPKKTKCAMQVGLSSKLPAINPRDKTTRPKHLNIHSTTTLLKYHPP